MKKDVSDPTDTDLAGVSSPIVIGQTSANSATSPSAEPEPLRFERGSKSGGLPTVRSKIEKSEIVGTAMIPREGSIEPLKLTKPDRSRPVSYIDSSLEKLDNLMEVASKSAEQSQDPRMVLAVAACASQIQKLVRMKVELDKK